MTNAATAQTFDSLLADAEVWLAHMIADLQQEHGVSSLLILAAVHGIITALMLEELGPDQTASICQRASDRIAGLSSLSDLARAIPAGRA